MSEILYCTNHPQTETLLRCNKCNRPMCQKCLVKVAVGYRCKECLGQQRAGYYNATSLDYALGTVVGLVVSAIAGFIVGLISGIFGLLGFILLGLFAGPAGGGLVSEAIRAVAGRRRGRYFWFVACVTIIVGGLVGVLNIGWLALLVALLNGNSVALSRFLLAGFGNLGFWIYAALAVSTAYYRLRV